MRTSWLAASLGAITLTAAVVLGPAASAAGASTSVPSTSAVPDQGILPPKNPPHDVNPPDPDFLVSDSCYNSSDTAKCNALVLRAVAHARQVLEKMTGMSFSLSAYEKLTPQEQLFVTANLERTARGLPAIVALTQSLDAVAQEGAAAGTAPPLGNVPGTLPGGGHPVSLRGNWAGGWVNALGADYTWMYDDKASAWDHRDNILAQYVKASDCGGKSYEIAMGAGHVTKRGAFKDSETELFAGICGPTPTDVVLTWAQAKQLLDIT